MEDTEFNQIRSDLLNYLARLTGDPELAEDLTQDAFIRVLGKGLEEKSTSDFRAYLFRTAINLMIDRKHGLDRRPAPEEFDEEITIPDESLKMAEGPLAAAIKNEMNGCIAGLLKKLPESDYQALGLINYGGMSVREAAEVMGVSVEAMKVRLHRSRKRLKDLMDRECDVAPDANGKLSCDWKQNNDIS
jgi:RNA polymerase sigma-70 factor (ECF subfamily)